MADKVRINISVTPLVEMTDSEANTVDSIHKSVGKNIGSQFDYTFDSSNNGDKFYYAPHMLVTNASSGFSYSGLIIGDNDVTDQVGATGDPDNTAEAAGGTAHFLVGGNIDSEDYVRFVCIKNTGTSDTTGTAISCSVYVRFTGTSDAPDTAALTPSTVEIAAGETWFGRVYVKVDEINIDVGAANGGGSASDTVRCEVLAIINDRA